MLIFVQIFSNWFRAWKRRTITATGEIQVTQKVKTVDATRDAGPLGELLGKTKPPTRRSAFNLYQELHYTTRVMPEYKKRWDNEQKEYTAHTPEERRKKKLVEPKSVRTMTKTTAEFWRNESDTFRSTVQAKADAWFDKATETYNLGLLMPKTPWDYHM